MIMEQIYANLIIKGRKQIDKVPEKIKAAVIKILIEKGFAELIESEDVAK